ncbi:MAG: HAMP domain-containing histidine kinase [Solirubrobacterales bacterium]|nr:HAMP domain-containing histidine kinase [Solirubrobacterales bacterium]
MSVQRSIGLHRLQLYSGIALAFMTIVSGVLGWVVAGRVLAPLRTITATTDDHRDNGADLGYEPARRIAMPGPWDELRLLADTIDRLLARLEFAFEAQRKFVANASHELRTPLSMMRTTLDVAIAKPGGVLEQMRELGAELRLDLDHADRLLESFLTLARAQRAGPKNTTRSRSSRSSRPRSAPGPTRLRPRGSQSSDISPLSRSQVAPRYWSA